MAILIQNTLTRKKEELLPLNPPEVNIYTCGVTVYDESHIGHARSLYVFDLIRRYLVYRGFKVNFVRNITDIDDKIINRAREAGCDWRELVNGYIRAYYRDLAFLGIDKADHEPRATENIPRMQEYITKLIEKGHAYQVDGEVYFSVRSFSGYGKLSGQSIEAMRENVRIEAREAKRDPLDFALWKKSKADEPAWMSPWGPGRPGWHIECSVMSQELLDTETLDIHAGGRDLVFPHHENEIAQSEALTGKPFARYWIHHGLLTIDGQKMSKSLGNFITIRDFQKKYKNADLLKLVYLPVHYAHPVDYTAERVAQSQQTFERLFILKQKLKSICFDVSVSKDDPGDAAVGELRARFTGAMDDDFNTPQALAALFDLVSMINRRLNEREFLRQAAGLFFEILTVLGLALCPVTGRDGIPDGEIARRIDERRQARARKNYAEADRIRRELEERGVILEDGAEGTSWRRTL